MIVSFASLTGISNALSQAWIAACWQGLVLAGAVAVCLRIFPGLSAARRSAVWAGVLVLLAGLHIFPLFRSQPLVNVLARAGQHASFRLDPHWSLALATLWLLTSTVLAGFLIRDLLRVQGIRSRSTALDLAMATNIRSSSEVTRPCVVGYRRPHILLPQGLVEQISIAELRQVLLHEQEHIRRGDQWLNLLQKTLLVLFPLNPALALVERKMCAERELACDDRVMHVTGARKAYALCLARIAEHRLTGRGAALVLGAWDRRPELVRRVERILQGTPVEMKGWRARATAGVVMLGSLAGSALLVQAPELVQFGSTPAVREQAAVLQPVSYQQERGFSRVELVKATLPSVHAMRPARPRRIFVRHARTKASTVVMASWASRRQGFAEATPASWKSVSQDANSQMLTVPAVFYVVPTAQGWVVIQL